MAIIHCITGGQRSGKSSYAQQLALKASTSPHYIATARVWDAEFEQRISRHKTDRDHRWTNHEIEIHISSAPIHNSVAVLDCITLWLTNIFTNCAYSADETLAIAKQEWNTFVEIPAEIFVVTNEIGMGTHAETEIGRTFTDIQGWMNQYIAAHAQTVTCMISGIPLQLK